LENQIDNPLLWIVALDSSARLSENQLVKRLHEDWGLQVVIDRGNEPKPGEPIAFRSGNSLIAIVEIDSQINPDETELLLKFHRHQPEAAKAVAKHTRHLVITVMGNDTALTRHILLSKVIASVLQDTPNSLCVLNTSRLLLNLPENFITDSQLLKEGNFALNQWVYFGYQNTKDGFTAYSYGMHSFGKEDVEIVDSHSDPVSVANFHYSICHYMVKFDKSIQPGETVGPTDDTKFATYLSEGVCVAHPTLKIPV
jgi:hypothetical protein